MTANTPSSRDLRKSLMYMANLSFDPDYEVSATIPLTLNPVSGALERTTGMQGNPSMTLAYDGDGNLTTLTKTIGATTYTKTFTWVGGRLTDVSEWI